MLFKLGNIVCLFNSIGKLCLEEEKQLAQPTFLSQNKSFFFFFFFCNLATVYSVAIKGHYIVFLYAVNSTTPSLLSLPLTQPPPAELLEYFNDFNCRQAVSTDSFFVLSGLGSHLKTSGVSISEHDGFYNTLPFSKVHRVISRKPHVNETKHTLSAEI
ncbi:hypothetical protein D5086_010390 [Populus alba]|uniref:Uncharacterized protein n=1 Tax=Populus alba TaxID=43335 RepID=A0ACC4CB06_POPAL